MSEDLYALHKIVKALQTTGHHIVPACSYAQAMIRAATEKTDIVVMSHGHPHEIPTYTAKLKAVRPDARILLVFTKSPVAIPVPRGVDMVARNVGEIRPMIERLLKSHSYDQS